MKKTLPGMSIALLVTFSLAQPKIAPSVVHAATLQAPSAESFSTSRTHRPTGAARTFCNRGKNVGCVSFPKTTITLGKTALADLTRGSAYRPVNVRAAHLLLHFDGVTKTLSSLKPGDIIVAGKSGATPDGLIRRVTSVRLIHRTLRSWKAMARAEQSAPPPDLGGTDVDTTSATLRDALGNKTMEFATDIPQQCPLNNADVPLGDRVTAQDSLCFREHVVFSSTPERTFLMVTAYEHAGLTVTSQTGFDAKWDKDVPVANAALPPLAGFAVFATLSFHVELQLHADYGVTEGISQDAAGSECVWMDGQGWHHASGPACGGSFTQASLKGQAWQGEDFKNTVQLDPNPPVFSGTASVTGDAGVGLRLLVDDLFGPEVDLDGHADASLSVPAKSVTVSRYFDLSGKACLNTFFAGVACTDSITLASVPIKPDVVFPLEGSSPSPPSPTPVTPVPPSPAPVPTPTPAPVRPGGLWISPADGQPIQGSVGFSAHAYPTHAGDPAIDYVNFTVGWPASNPTTWKVACTSSSPSGDVFSCSRDLSEIGAPAGPLRVSFDVYDKAHNANSSPNGEHTINWSPAQTCSTLTSGPLPSGCAQPTLRTDKSQYTLGDPVTICYTVPGPYHVHITVTKPDGSSVVALDQNDNGQGGCLQPQPAGPPFGTHTVRLDMSVNGSALASVSTQYTVSNPCATGQVHATIVTGPGCGSLTTDKSTYTMGENVTICYQMPLRLPAHVMITLTRPDGSSSTVLDADDDGSGECLPPGMSGPPAGTRNLQMVVSINGYQITTLTTTYDVVADTTESIQVNPSSGPAGSVVTVGWTDDGDDNNSDASGTVQFDGQTLGTFNTNDGAWTGQVQIPTSASQGQHTISVQDSDGSSQSTTFTVTGNGCQTACGGGGATITTSQSLYHYGDQVQICYTVPGPDHVTITITLPDGTSEVALDGDDDGSGGCIGGTASPPPGQRHVHLSVSSGGVTVATADTSYDVEP